MAQKAERFVVGMVVEPVPTNVEALKAALSSRGQSSQVLVVQAAGGCPSSTTRVFYEVSPLFAIDRPSAVEWNKVGAQPARRERHTHVLCGKHGRRRLRRAAA